MSLFLIIIFIILINFSDTTSNLLGIIISREFNRSRTLQYDVESHSDTEIYIPSIGKINLEKIIKENRSLYPYTFSILILRICTMPNNKMISLYIDSNRLKYFVGLLPGTVIRVSDVAQAKSKKRGNIYYKMKLSTIVEIIEHSPNTFETLKRKLEPELIKMETNTGRFFIQDIIQKFLVDDLENIKTIMFFASVTFVMKVLVKWKCFACNKDLVDKICVAGCDGRKVFQVESRYQIFCFICSEAIFLRVFFINPSEVFCRKKLPGKHQ